MHENVVHLHLIHFCDEQQQVTVRESELVVTSRECHKGVKSLLLNLQSQSEGKWEANIFETLKIDLACIVRSTPYMLFQPSS